MMKIQIFDEKPEFKSILVLQKGFGSEALNIA